MRVRHSGSRSFTSELARATGCPREVGNSRRSSLAWTEWFAKKQKLDCVLAPIRSIHRSNIYSDQTLLNVTDVVPHILPMCFRCIHSPAWHWPLLPGSTIGRCCYPFISLSYGNPAARYRKRTALCFCRISFFIPSKKLSGTLTDVTVVASLPSFPRRASIYFRV